MCLIFIGLKKHPRYKLVVAANRDEFYNRRTASADFWTDKPNILGGRDLEAGGTWLAMTKSGKLAMVTNYRDPKNINPQAKSRGHLIIDYLTGNDDPLAFSKKLTASHQQYNGFNLLVGNVDRLVYSSNYSDQIISMEEGIYGLSNALLDTPWPKVANGKTQFEKLLSRNLLDTEMLFEFMYNDGRAADDQLPDTGVGLERERALSAMFIKTNGYGTRCSTVILVDHRNQVDFSERVYDLTTFNYSTTRFSFPVEKAIAIEKE